ncbi:GGDEF domain-containing protein [Pseudomonas mosselii]|uniref:GGDEF domain-containing protein n=1 Tax=Pseudomonas mosselii TaxID=78327 RepID=UPI0021A82824|nr:GGDEF domain-containing protein [Pseudomonas mosselii]MEA3237770.1 GGDEF domain-containing protein [Pseudomonas mosselii]UWS69519.1 GGDEF domain-containing protein [Pseudomonas mosselii]
MPLSLPTLILVAVFILALMGILTLHAWRRCASDPSLGYLGAMLLISGLGVCLNALRGFGADYLALVLGNIVLLVGTGLGWTAMRVLGGRKPHWPLLLAGAVFWGLFSLWPGFYGDLDLRVKVYSLLTLGYTGLSIGELLRPRVRLQVSYTPALILTTLHAALYLMRTLLEDGVALDQAINNGGASPGFFAFILFESMLFAIGISYVTLAMVRERAEILLRAAAYSDPLTGIDNRRAFMARGNQLLHDCATSQVPVALLLCDLDHFKRINDRFGHPAGDEVLLAFARETARHLRRDDLFARIGGEEFACLLRGASEAEAEQVAQRICAGFSGLALLEPGLLGVSIGIVSQPAAPGELSRLLSMGDRALYAAKHQGRGRALRYAELC